MYVCKCMYYVSHLCITGCIYSMYFEEKSNHLPLPFNLCIALCTCKLHRELKMMFFNYINENSSWRSCAKNASQ